MFKHGLPERHASLSSLRPLLNSLYQCLTPFGVMDLSQYTESISATVPAAEYFLRKKKDESQIEFQTPSKLENSKRIFLCRFFKHASTQGA